MSNSIGVKNATKRFGAITVIPDLSIDIKNGEFFTLLGPSGCGKTTLLRMIAGFNSIEGGEFSFDETIINNIPAHKRNIGMVFQNYAIFPHLTVRQNVEYGLKIRKMDKSTMKKRVDDILDVVKIHEYQDRLPENLSGGQQQRVALARAIVIHPNVLLMDEPLSNLDAKLRIEMRSAIRDVQKQVGITTVYVTHDQEEALAISDRIAVMKSGIIQQVDTPEAIYSRPFNVFVSTFIGHSNLFHGKYNTDEKGKYVQFKDSTKIYMDNLIDMPEGTGLTVGIRPEELSLSDGGMKATIKNKTFLGRYIIYELDFEEGMILDGQASIEFSQDLGQAEKLYDVNDTLTLIPNGRKINVFTKDGEKSLIKDVRWNG